METQLSRAARPEPAPIALGGDPAVLVCAWCRRMARGVVATPANLPPWEGVSPAFVRVLERVGAASHGLCQTCRPAVAAAWGLAPERAIPRHA